MSHQIHRRIVTFLRAVVVVAVAAGLPAARAQQPEPEPPSLALPIRCTIGKDCRVQFYPDADPGPDIRDFHCGRTTYAQHRGTDIRVPSMDDVRRGVEVLAAAPGVVAAIRDGEPDIDIDVRGRDAVVKAGKSGGNLVVLRHDNGWTSLYWHMRQGSIRVQTGQSIAAGDVLGLVGLSGDTNFPHLHFELRYRNQHVDPFTGTQPRIAGRCGIDGKVLWSDEAAHALAWREITLLQAGFADQAPDRRGVEEHAPPQVLPAQARVLAFWWELTGLETGDRSEVKLLDPGNRIVAERVRVYDKRQGYVFDFIGRAARGGPWAAGTYSATLQIRRGQKLLIDERRAIEIR